ncbi:nucleotidyltransferase [Verrucomicrobiota bacterium sgz303538]
MKPSEIESSNEFYVAAVDVLQQAGIPFLVGGAYALRQYTGVVRDTKDFDVFLQFSDLDRTLQEFRKAGYHADLTYSHWLAKVHYGEAFIDLIFRAGNGLCKVTETWFRDTKKISLMDREVHLVRPEDMISQKAYIMERERFDGADIAHLLRHCAETMDWDYLIARFGPDWRVLLSHLVLFGFIYPGERSRIPESVMNRLMGQLQSELTTDTSGARVCQGTLISRAQYLPDIERWGYRDARLEGRSEITPDEIEAWTSAIGKERAWA